MAAMAKGTRDPLNAFLDVPEVPVVSTQTGRIAGLRLAVKDIYDVAGYRTGCGNPDRFAEAQPAAKTAPAVQTLLMAGARFVGKTQTDELAFSLMGINAHFPPPVNSAAPDRVTGGSSSGSAAAVAGRLAEIAIGSDTGGSIRAPASFCGLIGLRTTHGRVALQGAMRLAPSLDTFGWFADDIETYEAVGRLLLGRDSHRGILSRPLTIRRVDALVAGKEEEKAYERSIEIVEKATAPTDLESPFQSSMDELYWCLRRIQAYEAWRIHGEWLWAKPRRVSSGIRERIEFGASVDEATLRSEMKRRLAFRAELAEMLGKDGFLVLPTVPGAAPLKSASQEAMQVYREQALKLLCLAGLAGFPQITLPIGEVHGAPFGISLLGPAGSDIALIRMGRRVLEVAKNEKRE
jgi:amidase